MIAAPGLPTELLDRDCASQRRGLDGVKVMARPRGRIERYRVDRDPRPG
jgi:hypothetical protein